MKYLFILLFSFFSTLVMSQQTTFVKEKPVTPKTTQDLTKKASIAGTIKGTQDIVYKETYNSKGEKKTRYFIVEPDFTKGGMKKKTVYLETVNN